MAKSENQGLQIAVIIFAFLTIALSIATFYFFNDGQTQLANSVDQQQKAQEKENLARDLLNETNVLKEKIGKPQSAKIDDVNKKLDEQCSMFAGVVWGPDGKTWIKMVDTLKLTFDQMNQERKDQKQKMEELDRLLKEVQNKYQTDVQAKEEAFKKRNDELESLVKGLQAKDAEHVNKSKELEGELQKKRDEFAKANDDFNKEMAALKKERDEANRDAQYAKAELYKDRNFVFDRPDATIVSVSPKSQTVNIDVGRRDFLRLNIMFTVFDRGETNVHNRKKKGTISVTRFIEDNLAEARIVESDLKNPILQGDVVFTPTWNPGAPEHFVLAGDFDVNGDKKPDNDLVRTLVEMNGGVVDDDVSITTRYLLLGDAPSDKKSEAFAKYDKRRKRAQELSIKIMGLQEFLEYSGSAKTLSQLVSLGSPSKKELNDILKSENKRALNKETFRKREPEGGARRVEPGGAPRPTSGDSGGEGGKKSPALPPRRNSPVQ